MLRRLGYACICLGIEHGSPRGTILRRATPERLRDLINTNLATLRRVLLFNLEAGIGLFRISSDLIPFGSHPANSVRWWSEFRAPLREIGRLIREHDMRVSMHPGQYTVFSSPDGRIVDAARADVAYHGRLLDSFDLDSRHKIVIHVGGAYGDKPAALARWTANILDLPNDVRHRLVLENDDRLFGMDDVLQASVEADVPVVMDVFHHRVLAGPTADSTLVANLRRAAATWQPERDGVPKIHYSSQAAGQRAGAHAEYVDPLEFARFLKLTLTLAPADVNFDCMLEAKAKDRALLLLRESLGIAA